MGAFYRIDCDPLQVVERLIEGDDALGDLVKLREHSKLQVWLNLINTKSFIVAVVIEHTRVIAWLAQLTLEEKCWSAGRLGVRMQSISSVLLQQKCLTDQSTWRLQNHKVKYTNL